MRFKLARRGEGLCACRNRSGIADSELQTNFGSIGEAAVVLSMDSILNHSLNQG